MVSVGIDRFVIGVDRWTKEYQRLVPGRLLFNFYLWFGRSIISFFGSGTKN